MRRHQIFVSRQTPEETFRIKSINICIYHLRFLFQNRKKWVFLKFPIARNTRFTLFSILWVRESSSEWLPQKETFFFEFRTLFEHISEQCRFFSNFSTILVSPSVERKILRTTQMIWMKHRCQNLRFHDFQTAVQKKLNKKIKKIWRKNRPFGCSETCNSNWYSKCLKIHLQQSNVNLKKIRIRICISSNWYATQRRMSVSLYTMNAAQYLK